MVTDIKERISNAIADNDKAWRTTYRGIVGWSLIFGYSTYKLVSGYETIGAIRAQEKYLKALRDVSTEKKESE